jgi:hypothetical protein
VETDRGYDSKPLTICDAGTGRKLVTREGHPDQLNDWDFARDGAIQRGGPSALIESNKIGFPSGEREVQK